jgi:hypothetical protein
MSPPFCVYSTNYGGYYYLVFGMRMLLGHIMVKDRLPEMRKCNNDFETVLPGCWFTHRLRGWVLMSTMWDGLRSDSVPFSQLSMTSVNGSVDVLGIQSSLHRLCCFLNHQRLLIGASAMAMGSAVSGSTTSKPLRILKHYLITYILQRDLI